MAEKMKLGEILVKSGALSLKDLETFLKEQEDLQDERGYRTKLGDLLLEHKMVNEETLALAFAEQHGFKFVDLNNYRPDVEVLANIPFSILSNFRFVPLYLDKQKTVIALHDPIDSFLLDLLYKALEVTIEVQSATRTMVDMAHRSCVDAVKNAGRENHDFDINFEEYRLVLEQEKEVVEIKEREEVSLKHTLDGHSLEQILKLFARSQQAVALRIALNRAEATVLERRPGGWHYFGSLSHARVQAFITQIKSLAGLPEEALHYPTQAYFETTIDEETAAFGAYLVPSQMGTEVVIENYGLDRRSLSTSRLGILDHDLNRLLSGNEDQGILILGNAHGGRTTLLTALLNDRLRKSSEAQLVLEMHPSAQAMGRTHVALDEDLAVLDSAGLVAAGYDTVAVDGLPLDRLGWFLKQCERRTVFASLDGGPVLPFLAQLEKSGQSIGSVLGRFRSIIHIRLVPQACPWCGVSQMLPPAEIAKSGIKPETLKKPIFTVNGGCEACENTGCLDFTPIYEVLNITPPTLKLLMENPISNELAMHLVKSGVLVPTSAIAREKLYRGTLNFQTWVGIMQKQI